MIYPTEDMPESLSLNGDDQLVARQQKECVRLLLAHPFGLAGRAVYVGKCPVNTLKDILSHIFEYKRHLESIPFPLVGPLHLTFRSYPNDLFRAEDHEMFS